MVLFVVAGNSATRTGNHNNTNSQSCLESCCCFFPHLIIFSRNKFSFWADVYKLHLASVLGVTCWLMQSPIRGPLWLKETWWCCWWGTWGSRCGSSPWGCCLTWILAAAQKAMPILDEMEGVGSPEAWDCWKSKLLESAQVDYFCWLCRNEISPVN